jgi:hypothetical protein
MIFVDNLRPCLRNKNWKYDKSCHLFADTIEELKIFATSIKLNESWFQNNRRLPHFDLTEVMRIKAVNNGAIELSNKDFLKRLLKAGKIGAKAGRKLRQELIDKQCPHCEFIENTFYAADITDSREYWIMTEVFVYLHKGDSCNYKENEFSEIWKEKD